MSVRRSYTAIVERNTRWEGEFATEPYEAAWASEAIFFVRALDVVEVPAGTAYVQISADGFNWVDEGTSFYLPEQENAVTFCKVCHFGGFLRLRGELPAGGITVLVSLVLKE